MLSRPLLSAGSLVLLCGLAGCAGMNHTQNGALVGTGLGAATGAIIGHQTGNRDAGALIGAAVGGLGGALAGNNADMHEQRDAAVAQAAWEQQARAADARAMTGADVIQMTQAGVSDSVILSAIRSRGGRFDTSPQSIVALKQSGVSDTVIEMMIAASPGPSAQGGFAPGTMIYQQPGTVVVSPVEQPPAVYIAPRPRPSVSFTVGPRPYGPRYFRRHWHRRHHHHH